MEFHRNSMPPADGGSAVVTGHSLHEAFKKVRQEFGPEAVISGSRTRSRRKSSGWGSEQIFEVMVETSESPSLTPQGAGFADVDLAGEIRHEVERLEQIVQDICKNGADPAGDKHDTTGNHLAEHLVENGASPDVVDRLMTRFAGETGRPQNDRPGAIAWLAECLGTGERALADWEGNHVFLGEHATDRLDLVLHLARRLTEVGRRVLVVAVLPEPDRDEPRLKKRAAAAGHDAAVMREISQLSDMEDHLTGYDMVLLDLPGLMEHDLAEGGPVYRWLASNEKFHRHLLMPMDRDFRDLCDIREAVRSWNFDWLVLTRLDGTRRAAKLLDLLDRIPLPVSFMAENSVGEGLLASATTDLLLDTILDADVSPRFRPGTEQSVL